MPYHSMAWSKLEQWDPIGFLVAGGLFLFPAGAYVSNTTTGTERVVSPAFIFVSLLVVFFGLFGLYPRLAERDSILAQDGGGLLAVTAATIVSTLGATLFPMGIPSGRSTVVAIPVTVAVGSILTFTMTGVASFRTGANPRPVGGCLLAMAAGEACLVAATLPQGNPSPPWVALVVSVLFATSLGASGYVLRTPTPPTGISDSAGWDIIVDDEGTLTSEKNIFSNNAEGNVQRPE